MSNINTKGTIFYYGKLGVGKRRPVKLDYMFIEKEKIGKHGIIGDVTIDYETGATPSFFVLIWLSLVDINC